MSRLSRTVAIRMLLFHKVPAVRRLAKRDSVALLRIFYACRTIQRWARRTFVFAAPARVERPQRSKDTSTLDAMRHILALTLKGAIEGHGSCAAHAIDVQRLVRAMLRISREETRVACDFWVGEIHKHGRHVEMATILHSLQLTLTCEKARPTSLHFYRKPK